MPKTIPMHQRLMAPVYANLTIALRTEVERLARKERVGVGEIARRAITEYVRQQAEQGRKR